MRAVITQNLSAHPISSLKKYSALINTHCGDEADRKYRWLILQLHGIAHRLLTYELPCGDLGKYHLIDRNIKSRTRKAEPGSNLIDNPKRHFRTKTPASAGVFHSVVRLVQLKFYAVGIFTKPTLFFIGACILDGKAGVAEALEVGDVHLMLTFI